MPDPFIQHAYMPCVCRVCTIAMAFDLAFICNGSDFLYYTFFYALAKFSMNNFRLKKKQLQFCIERDACGERPIIVFMFMGRIAQMLKIHDNNIHKSFILSNQRVSVSVSVGYGAVLSFGNSNLINGNVQTHIGVLSVVHVLHTHSKSLRYGLVGWSKLLLC